VRTLWGIFQESAQRAHMRPSSMSMTLSNSYAPQ
jgi:hypothetical protein